MPQVGPVRPGRSLRGVSARVSIPQEEGLGGGDDSDQYAEVSTSAPEGGLQASPGRFGG